ncbi:MAG: NAD(P)-binding domain-containing protein [Ardenticatenaceae bacterium]|nr:NAD(P)-binding domain-containing protein [Ardenticatenaceae bacterium]
MPPPTLLTKIAHREARVAIIGLGYVGLPLAVAFARAGFRVTGIDVDRRKVDAITRGESYIQDVPSGVLAHYTVASAAHAAVGSTNGAVNLQCPDADAGHLRPSNLQPATLHATTDFSVLTDCDAVSICVPTPLRKTGDPDISYIVAAADEIARYLHPGMLVVLESTTYPGTTTEVILPRLAGNGHGLEVDKDFFLCFSPERIDPSRRDWTTVNTPKVMGGTTPVCLPVGRALTTPTTCA